MGGSLVGEGHDVVTEYLKEGTPKILKALFTWMAKRGSFGTAIQKIALGESPQPVFHVANMYVGSDTDVSAMLAEAQRQVAEAQQSITDSVKREEALTDQQSNSLLTLLADAQHRAEAAEAKHMAIESQYTEMVAENQQLTIKTREQYIDLDFARAFVKILFAGLGTLVLLFAVFSCSQNEKMAGFKRDIAFYLNTRRYVSYHGSDVTCPADRMVVADLQQCSVANNGVRSCKLVCLARTFSKDVWYLTNGYGGYDP